MQPLQESPEHQEYVQSQQKRLKLRQNMHNAIQGYAFIDELLSLKTSKVSSINKFTSKLKTDNRNIEQLITEMETLNISKFLDEIAIIIASTTTTSEVKQLAQMACRIGMLYEGFPVTLIKQLKKQIDYKLNQEDRSQLLALFHLIIQLFVYGFPLLQSDIPQLIKKVFKTGINPKDITPMDHSKKQRNYAFNIDFYWVLAKEFGQVFCGLTSKRMENWIKQGRKIVKFPEMVTVQIKKSISSFLQKYVKQVSIVLQQSVINIKKMQGVLRDQLKLNGKFDSKTEKNYNEIVQRYIKTKSKLLDIGQSIPTSISYEGIQQNILSPQQISKQQFSISETGQIFEDQYQKELYVKLMSIGEQNVKVEDSDKLYQQFKGKLQTCKNTQDADSIVQQFLLINTKKTRKLLVKDLLDYRKQYQLVTPFLCRIAATINKKWKDVEQNINEQLFNDYDKLKDSASTNFITMDKKTRNMKYICELTKFGMVDPQKVIACMKSLVDDLIGPNIELLLLCLQSVGRYLYLTKQSTSKFVFLLTQLKNVMKKKPLPIMIQSQINNCIALLKPIQAVTKKEKTVKSQTQVRIKQLLKQISKDNVDLTVQQIGKLIQNNKEAQDIFIKRFIKRIPKHQYIENYLFAVLIDRLQKKQITDKIKIFTKQIIIEMIEREESQQCLSWSRFFGELFNYSLISKDEYYEFLKRLLKFEQNETGVINSVCTIISSCKQQMKVKKTSSINQKLRFLLDFKSYINTRNYIPMFIQFEILDLLEQIQPQIMSLSNQEIIKFKTFMEQKQLSRDKEVNQLKQIQLFTASKRKPLYKQKTEDEEYNREQQPQRREITQETKVQHDLEQQFQFYQKQEIQKSMGRIAKPKIAESSTVKKKKPSQKGLVILGRSGDKVIRKQVNIRL